MKLLSLVVLVAAVCAAPVHAADRDPSPSAAPSVESSAPQGKTRAEVKAETLRAIKAGEVPVGDVGYPTERPLTQPRVSTRASR